MEKRRWRKLKLINIKYVLAIVIAVIFAGFFIYNAAGVFSHLLDGRRARQNSEIAQEMFGGAVTSDELLVMNYAELLREAREVTGNPDVVGFVTIGGTNIGDLVVQGEDNEFYLTHNAYKDPNANGALFMDYRNSPHFDDQNTIIYGHNMRNGTMFNNLRHFMRQDFFEAHPEIVVVSGFSVLRYEIFAAFATSTDFYYIQVHFDRQAEFESLLVEIKNRNVIETAVNVYIDDRIIILSTCTNHREDTRFVIAGRLVTD